VLAGVVVTIVVGEILLWRSGRKAAHGDEPLAAAGR
jgi:hypothetical protein